MNSSSAAERLLEQYHAAMLAADVDAFAELYATDGVHEFPFLTPGGVNRLVGRVQIRQHYRRLWADPPVVVDRIDNLAVHQTGDPQVIINEFSAAARRRSGGDHFELSGVIALTEQEGQIAHVRDYMDLLRVASNAGGLAGGFVRLLVSAIGSRFGRSEAVSPVPASR